MTLASDVDVLLQDLGVPRDCYHHGSRTVPSPLTGATIASVQDASRESMTEAIARAKTAFLQWRSRSRTEAWRTRPASWRGTAPAQGGTRTTGHYRGRKNSSRKGLGEVQEMIDICDFAVGLSRQLYGLTIASERPNHRMMEQWHPLGPVGIITVLQFPGCGLGVERRAGFGLRQSGDLEAVGKNAADGARGAGAVRARGGESSAASRPASRQC